MQTVNILFSLLGCGIAVFGVAAMRDPMRFSLSKLTRAWHQRMMLDRGQRLQLRFVGTMVSVFGLVMGTMAVGLQSVSQSLLVLLGILFVGGFASGVVLFVVQIARGTAFDWWRAYREAAQLGPINVYPSITPEMQREANFFTIGWSLLVTIAFIAGLVRR